MKFTKKQLESRARLRTLVEKNWILAKGKSEYLKCLGDEEPTRKEAMLALCYACMVGYDGGKEDCLGITCPMYFYYPYRDGRSRKELTPEKLASLQERMRHMHQTVKERKENGVHEPAQPGTGNSQSAD